MIKHTKRLLANPRDKKTESNTKKIVGICSMELIERVLPEAKESWKGWKAFKIRSNIHISLICNRVEFWPSHNKLKFTLTAHKRAKNNYQSEDHEILINFFLRMWMFFVSCFNSPRLQIDASLNRGLNKASLVFWTKAVRQKSFSKTMASTICSTQSRWSI